VNKVNEKHYDLICVLPHSLYYIHTILAPLGLKKYSLYTTTIAQDVEKSIF